MINVPKPTRVQQEFIDCLDKSILLQACVGTGKTFALAHRVAKAISEGVAPDRILCVTFTNRAAEEMRQRIHHFCPKDSNKVVTKTFHGLCAWVLRHGARQLGIPQDFGIIDEDDAQDIIAQLQLQQILPITTAQIYQLIQAYKVEGKLISIENAPGISQSLVEKMASVYQQEIASLKCFDFGDLIVFASKALAQDGPLHKEWNHRFDMVLVDEMQDTHLTEYEIITNLAHKSQNLVLAGDFDQTIYEWRGSTPDKVIEKFKQDFPSHREMQFVENHRATKNLIHAAQSVVSSYSNTLPKPTDSTPTGHPIRVHGARDERMEAEWIASTIKNLASQGTSYDRIGVLARSNRRASVISEAMQRKQVPHITVETYEFFRRQEVKDSIAYLKFLLNPDDSMSFNRILKRPSRGIGDRTLQRIEESAIAGLRLTDFASLSTLQATDPFASLFLAFENGTIIVFDCETTGIDPTSDDIIEIAAYKIQRGKLVETFHKYLLPRKPVGQSVYIHGITDEFLAKHGADPQKTLQAFIGFIGNSLLVGHNVSFDIRMVLSASKRHQITFPCNRWFDTLTLARRFIATNSYKLADLATRLNLPHKPSHRADADVAATWDLLQYLIPKMEKNIRERQRIIEASSHLFWPLAEHFAKWRELMQELRPAQLLRAILEDSGLLAYYQKEPQRLKNIEELIRTSGECDDLSLHPTMALESLVNFASLARNIDRLDLKSQVAVVTVHQSKGLEFDVVFMSGLSAYEFPNYGATKQGKEREERRLFYVGITRAKQRLFLSYYLSRDGRSRAPSEYIKLLPGKIVEQSS